MPCPYYFPVKIYRSVRPTTQIIAARIVQATIGFQVWYKIARTTPMRTLAAVNPTLSQYITLPSLFNMVEFLSFV
jgi:hypothetical protein